MPNFRTGGGSLLSQRGRQQSNLQRRSEQTATKQLTDMSRKLASQALGIDPSALPSSAWATNTRTISGREGPQERSEKYLKNEILREFLSKKDLRFTGDKGRGGASALAASYLVDQGLGPAEAIQRATGGTLGGVRKTGTSVMEALSGAMNVLGPAAAAFAPATIGGSMMAGQVGSRFGAEAGGALGGDLGRTIGGVVGGIGAGLGAQSLTPANLPAAGSASGPLDEVVKAAGNLFGGDEATRPIGETPMAINPGMPGAAGGVSQAPSQGVMGAVTGIGGAPDFGVMQQFEQALPTEAPLEAVATNAGTNAGNAVSLDQFDISDPFARQVGGTFESLGETPPPDISPLEADLGSSLAQAAGRTGALGTFANEAPTPLGTQFPLLGEASNEIAGVGNFPNIEPTAPSRVPNVTAPPQTPAVQSMDVFPTGETMQPGADVIQEQISGVSGGGLATLGGPATIPASSIEISTAPPATGGGEDMGIIDILQGGAKKVTDFLDSPLGKLAIPAAGVLVGAIQQGKQADASRDIAETALDRGDPAGERRGQFQDELSDLYETGEVPFFEPALGHAADAAARRAASQGYNLSNNFVHEVARAVAPLYTQQANRQAEILGALGGFDITPQIQPFVDQAGLAAGLDSSKYEDIFGLMASIPEKAAADRRFKQVMGMLAGMRGMV